MAHVIVPADHYAPAPRPRLGVVFFYFLFDIMKIRLGSGAE